MTASISATETRAPPLATVIANEPQDRRAELSFQPLCPRPETTDQVIYYDKNQVDPTSEQMEKLAPLREQLKEADFKLALDISYHSGQLASEELFRDYFAWARVAKLAGVELGSRYIEQSNLSLKDYGDVCPTQRSSAQDQGKDRIEVRLKPVSKSAY